MQQGNDRAGQEEPRRTGEVEGLGPTREDANQTSWIEKFLRYSEISGRPRLFRLWSAISTISAVMQRRVWIRTGGRILYPNLYIILVAPPGVGKSWSIDFARDLLHELGTVHVCVDSANYATIIDELADARVDVITPKGEAVTYHALFVCQDELSVLLPANDIHILGRLQKLWDNPPAFSERRRMHNDGESLVISEPQVGMLTGCQPSYLSSILQPAAWDQGFIPRSIMAFSGETNDIDYFTHQQADEGIFTELVEDLQKMQKLFGQFRFTAEYPEAFRAWQAKGKAPVPDHPRLVNYNVRRDTNVLKLSMISALDRGAGLNLDAIDFHRALGWLVEAETTIPDIFRAMGSSGGDSNIIQETYYFVYQAYMRNGMAPVKRWKLIEFLQERAPSYSIDRIVQTMCDSGLLRKERDETAGDVFVPRTKRENAV